MTRMLWINTDLFDCSWKICANLYSPLYHFFLTLALKIWLDCFVPRKDRMSMSSENAINPWAAHCERSAGLTLFGSQQPYNDAYYTEILPQNLRVTYGLPMESPPKSKQCHDFVNIYKNEFHIDDLRHFSTTPTVETSSTATPSLSKGNYRSGLLWATYGQPMSKGYSAQGCFAQGTSSGVLRTGVRFAHRGFPYAKHPCADAGNRKGYPYDLRALEIYH